MPAKLILATLFVVSFVFSVAGVLSYYDVFLDQGIYPVLEGAVSSYRSAVHQAFSFLDDPLRSLVAWFAQVFRANLELQPYWKDIFVPTWLYFASLAFAARADGRVAYRRALFVFGLLLAFIFSVFVATSSKELSSAPALEALVLSVVLYELGAFVLLLLLVKKMNRASAPNFGTYLIEKPLTTLAMGIIAAMVLQLVLAFEFADYESAIALVLIGFILLLGLRDIALAIFFAVQNRNDWPGSFKDRLFSSKSWLLGSMIVLVILAASAGVVREG